MPALLLDSAILIDHFRGVVEATNYLRSRYREAAVSVVTRAEVLTGFEDARAEARIEARSLLDRFPTLAIDRDVADRAAELRRRHRWKLPDAFQAALALHHGLLLVTRDGGDFPPERFGFVEIPYRL